MPLGPRLGRRDAGPARPARQTSWAAPLAQRARVIRPGPSRRVTAGLWFLPISGLRAAMQGVEWIPSDRGPDRARTRARSRAQPRPIPADVHQTGPRSGIPARGSLIGTIGRRRGRPGRAPVWLRGRPACPRNPEGFGAIRPTTSIFPGCPRAAPSAATSCTASPARSSAAQPNRQGSAERDESLIWARISHFPSWRNRLASVHWAKPSGVWGWRPGGSPKPRSRALFRSPRQTLPQPTREGAREAGRGRVVY